MKAACGSDPVSVGAGDPEVSLPRGELGCPTYAALPVDKQELRTARAAGTSSGGKGHPRAPRVCCELCICPGAQPGILPVGTPSPPDPEHYHVTPVVPAAASCCVPHSCLCRQPFPQPSLPHTCPTQPSGTHLSRRTTPSMHAPKSTTELMSVGRSRTACKMQSPTPPCPALEPIRPTRPQQTSLPALPAHLPILTQSPDRALKDTDCRGGGNGQDGACGDGLLCIPQVPRAIGASHDAWGQRAIMWWQSHNPAGRTDQARLCQDPDRHRDPRPPHLPSALSHLTCRLRLL